MQNVLNQCPQRGRSAEKWLRILLAPSSGRAAACVAEAVHGARALGERVSCVIAVRKRVGEQMTTP